MRLKIFFLILSLFTAPLLATSYVMVADDALADQARLVLVGTVERAESIVANPPYTRYYFRSERLLKGQLVAETVAVDVAGGVTPSGSRLVLMGNPSLATGQRLILFLVPTRTDSYGILHVNLGAFREQVVGNRRIARRDLAGSAEVGSRTAGSTDFHRSRDFDKFANWLQDFSAGAGRAMDYFVDASKPADSFTDTFSLGGLARHDKFDKGETVEWVRNAGGQPNLPNGGDVELNAALAVWNDDLNTNIDQTLVGSVPGNPGFTENEENNISYGDPDNTMPGAFSCQTGGTLGRGGFRTRGSHPYGDLHGDQNYLTIMEVDLSMNDGVDCELTGDAAGRAKAAEVYTHEIGHTLGLGHSCQTSPFCLDPVEDDATMRPDAHFDGRGASLRIDDRRGIQFIYPNFVEDFAQAIFAQYIDLDQVGATRIVIRNNGSQTDTGRINFQNADGDPQLVPVSISGSAPTGLLSSVAFAIPAGGVFDVSTAGTGNLAQGSIEVVSDLDANSRLEATEAFEVLSNFVSVPSAKLAAVQQVFVSVNNDENTGFAAYNPNSTTVDMDLCMIDSAGNERAETQLSLAPRERIVGFLDDVSLFNSFLDSVNNNFTGTMNISTRNGEVLAILGLLQKAGSGALIAVETSTNAPHPEP